LAAFADPISHLQALTTGNPNNHSGWTNAAYDQLVSRIGQLAPGPERKRLVQEAQKILLVQECPVVPIYHYNQAHGVSSRVSGLRVNGMGIIRWDELQLKAAGGA
jgi:dipeptide transport system substrate-binding protein